MSNGHKLEVYDDLEDNLFLYYEDSMHGQDITARIHMNGHVDIMGWDEVDEDKPVVKETINIQEFLRRVLER